MVRALVIAEHVEGRVRPATGAAAGFAAQVCSADGGGEFDILVLGCDVSAAAEHLTELGARAVLLADDFELKEPVADRYAEMIRRVARERKSTLLVAAASTFSKDILPRAAALLDAGMASDVVGFEAEAGQLTFRRVLCAGNALAEVRLAGEIRVLTVRSSAFSAPPRAAAPSPVTRVAVDPSTLPRGASVVRRDARASGRPDAADARIVVSGGRALKNADDFERLIGGLADALGGAIGSSRALVDSGITPNSLQIGQTGKIVAPDLYLAVGISGAIQHTAGMKDAKVVAAINQDPEAPIFETADYGLVADIYQAVPELIAKLKPKDK